eukprot:Platyproteum_vivax@DN7105_c0_g1_i2.p1
MCPHDRCRETKFIVFDDPTELKLHLVNIHGDNDRRLPTNFSVGKQSLEHGLRTMILHEPTAYAQQPSSSSASRAPPAMGTFPSLAPSSANENSQSGVWRQQHRAPAAAVRNVYARVPPKTKASSQGAWNHGPPSTVTSIQLNAKKTNTFIPPPIQSTGNQESEWVTVRSGGRNQNLGKEPPPNHPATTSSNKKKNKKKKDDLQKLAFGG